MIRSELIALYTAHGVDLSRAGGNESNTKGLARRRRMSKEERKQAKGRPVVETAEGAGSRVMRPRAWSHAEVGMAAGGLVLGSDGKPVKDREGRYRVRMPRMPWLAACFSIAGDYDGYKELHRALTVKALECAKRGNWQWQVDFVDGRSTYYIERLAELVLDTEGCPAHFALAAQQLVGVSPHAIYMGVTEAVWRKPLYAYFVEIQGQYQRWLDTAQGVVGRPLRAEDLREEPEEATVAPEPSNAA